MPGLGGLEATRVIRRASPDTKVLLLTLHNSIELVETALRAGARGFLLKSDSEGELVLALTVVAENGIYISPGLELDNFVLITVHPEKLALAVRDDVNLVIAIGPDSAQIVREINPRVNKERDSRQFADLESRSGEMLAWKAGEAWATRVKLERAKKELRRHKRKYATGELGEDKSFYFRGLDYKMNIRIQNLPLFVQVAERIDDET
jgi:DNA-binding response OmpR family regulator